MRRRILRLIRMKKDVSTWLLLLLALGACSGGKGALPSANASPHSKYPADKWTGVTRIRMILMRGALLTQGASRGW